VSDDVMAASPAGFDAKCQICEEPRLGNLNVCYDHAKCGPDGQPSNPPAGFDAAGFVAEVFATGAAIELSANGRDDFREKKQMAIANLTAHLVPHLARGAADDGMAIDETWVSSLPGAERDKFNDEWFTFKADGFNYNIATDGRLSVEDSSENESDVLILGKSTRGDVRRLAAALGITLKETR
jgi:hypothetical protein